MNNGFDALEELVDRAHGICDGLLLFEAVEMEASEVISVLEQNHVFDPVLQERYLGIVKEYDQNTGNTDRSN